MLLGWKAGVTVALHDIGKAIAAVLIAGYFFPELEYAGAAAGVAAVLGHIFPFYLGFKGGKGLASFFGLAAALDWKLGLMAGLVILLATVITDFISIGALSVIVLGPLYVGVIRQDLQLAAVIAVASVAMLYKHWENIGRLIRKEEIGLRSTIRGDKRLK